VLIGSNQKVSSQEQGLTRSLFTDAGLLADKREPNPLAFMRWNTETPYRSEKSDSQSQDLPMTMREQEVGKSEGCSVTEQIPV
jgi:hypothetical protein